MRIKPPPQNVDPGLYSHLLEMHKVVSHLVETRYPPSQASNLRVTPIALGNHIEFTRSPDATGHTLLISSSPNWVADGLTPGLAVDLGDSNVFNDNTGQAGLARYYWVRPRRGDLYRDPPLGPIKGVTLGAAATITLPKSPPPGQLVTTSDLSGKTTFLQPLGGPGRFNIDR